MERSDRMWSTGEGNGKPLQHSCLENSMNSMKRQNDRIGKEELPRWVLFLLWFHPFILSGVISQLISSSILGTYRPGEFLFKYLIILPFYILNGILKARSVFIPIPKKGNAKECSNYRTIALISYTSKAMLKILQAKLQQYMNRELPDVQAGFRKGRGTRDQIAKICWIIEKAREFQKNISFCFIDYAKAFDCWITINCGKYERDGNTRPPDLPLEKPICRSEGNS